MKTYYRECGRDSVICVFSDEPLPSESTGLSQSEVWQHFKCLTATRNSEPLINDCTLSYLLSTAVECSEEEAATITGPMVELLKKAEEHANSKNR